MSQTMKKKPDNSWLVTTPSSAVLKVIPLNGDHVETVGAIESLEEDPKAVHTLLDSLFTFVDYGPYYLGLKAEHERLMKAGDKPWTFSWNDILVPDLNMLLASGQAATYGPILPYDQVCRPCAVNPRGVTRWRHKVKIHLLPTTMIPDEIIKRLLDAKATFITDLFGYDITLCLAAHPERKVEVHKNASAKRKMAAALLSHIVSVDLEDVDDSAESIMEDWAIDLTLGQTAALTKLIQEQCHGYGLPTEVHSECPRCGDPNLIQLPFALSWISGGHSTVLGDNMKLIAGLRKFRGSSLYQALNQLEPSNESSAAPGEATATDTPEPN